MYRGGEGASHAAEGSRARRGRPHHDAAGTTAGGVVPGWGSIAARPGDSGAETAFLAQHSQPLPLPSPPSPPHPTPTRLHPPASARGRAMRQAIVLGFALLAGCGTKGTPTPPPPRRRL